MTSGGTGLDFGDDYVAARLSIDVPAEGIQGVREITEAVDRFRTSMEAATRSEADMTSHLDRMAESAKRAAEAQANLAQQVSNQMSQHASAAGVSSGVPTGAMQQPFQGATLGMGGSVLAAGARPPSPTDVAYQLSANAQQSQLSHLNFAQARGGVDTSSMNISAASIGALASAIASREHAMSTQNQKTGGGQVPRTPPEHHGGAVDPYDQFQARAGAATGLAGNVMNELNSGNGMAGFSGMAQQGINALRKHMAKRSGATNAPSSGGGESGASDPNSNGGGGEEGTGGMGGLLKGLGIAGGAMGVITGGLALLNKGGGMVQGWRNVGAEVGGGSGEGFKASMAARSMALDPTVSTDEARSRMQLVMSHGYNKSGSLDDLGSQGPLEFMSNNYAKYGMDAAHSMQLLDLSAHNTKISLAALTDGLDEMHAAAKNSVLGQDQIQAVAVNYATSMAAQGADPGMALKGGIQASEMYANNPILAGKSGGIDTQSMTSLERMYGGAGGTPLNIPGGLRPDAVAGYLSDKGMTQEARQNVYMHYAQLAQSSAHDTTKGTVGGPNISTARRNAHAAFVGMVSRLLSPDDPQNNPQALMELYDTLIWGGGVKKAMANQQQAQMENTAGGRKTGDRTAGYGGAPSRPGAFGGQVGPKAYGSQILDRILNTYNGDENQIEVMDKSGKKIGTLDTTNREMVDKLGSGEYKWRHKGDKGKGITESDTPSDLGGEDYSTDQPGTPGKGLNGKGKAGVHGTGSGTTSDSDRANNATVQIDLSDAAKQLLQVKGKNPVPLSANDIDAKRGAGQASVNDPPSRDFVWGRH